MSTIQRAPAGLKASGRRLWAAVTGPLELDEWELTLLVQACRTADLLDRLAVEAGQGELTVVNRRGDEVANPCLVESRQQAITYARLLAALRLPSGEEQDRPQRRQIRGAYGVRALGSVSQASRRRLS